MQNIKDFILSIDGGYKGFAEKLNQLGANPPITEDAAYVMAHRNEIPKARWAYVMSAFSVSLSFLQDLHTKEPLS